MDKDDYKYVILLEVFRVFSKYRLRRKALVYHISVETLAPLS